MIYDRTDLFDAALAQQNPTYSLQPWVGNGTRDVVLLLEQVPAPGTGTIGNQVWSDLDSDGVQDAGEPGLAGVLVQLLNDQGDVLAWTTTDANGHYQFANLAAGTYRLHFVAPPGYEFTAANQGGDESLDSDADAAGFTDLFSLAVGQIHSDLDAGLVGLIVSEDL